MTKQQAKANFKKHYKMAMRLKEGGKAWEREINLAHRYLEIGRAKYQAELKARYQE